MKIEKSQIKTLLAQFSAIYDLQQEMSKNLKWKKTFALDGRIIGDIGECLASYLYDIDIEEKQTPGQDGVFVGDGKPVEIKVRTKDKNGHINHIHISKSTMEKNGCYLIVFAFDTKERTINVEVNDWLSKKIFTSLPRTEKGFVTMTNLKSKIKKNDKENDLKKIKISGWTITYKEGLK